MSPALVLERFRVRMRLDIHVPRSCGRDVDIGAVNVVPRESGRVKLDVLNDREGATELGHVERSAA